MNLIEASFDYTLFAALLLAVAHLFGPSIRQGMRLHTDLVRSFGGGLAVAYVFLQLFPEIEAGHEWLGDEVHVVTLVSFLLFYALEIWLHRRRESDGGRVAGFAPVSGGDHGAAAIAGEGHPEAVFWWHIAVSSFYTCMVIFALPSDIASDFELSLITSLAIGLHLIYKDFVLRTHHSSAFETRGQLVLAVSPLVGWIAHNIITPPEVLLDLFVAVLAGFLMQNVFRDELPNNHSARLPWLFGGAASFTVLAFLLS